jgi:hypothetical protein
VSITRQQDIFRHVGYQYNWNFLGPFWHFLGKIVAKALFNNDIQLDVLNYFSLGRREFAGYTTPMWTAAVKARQADGLTEPLPLNVIETSFKKPVPAQPLEMSWAPARSRILIQIERCRLEAIAYVLAMLTQRYDVGNEDSGCEEDNPELSD